MNNSLKIYINYYDILSKIFFLGLAFFAILFYILNTSQIFAEEETDTTIFIAYDTDNLNDNEDYKTSKDIILQIANYYSIKENVSVIIQSYGSMNGEALKIDEENVNLSIEEFLFRIDKKLDSDNPNHYLAISDGFTQIAENKNVSNSKFYLISPLKTGTLEDSANIKLNNLADLYQSSEITLNVMSMPSSLAENREFFSKISAQTNGDFIDFGSNKSFTDFIKIFLDEPILLVDTNLDSKPLSNFINVAPTVEKLRIGIYRQDIETKISLITPSGTELEENSDYNFWELDKIVFLDINNPDSGTWTIITNGSLGKYEIYTDSSNPLELRTYGEKFYPINSEIILEVGAYIDNELLNISDAELQVRIRDFEGIETIQIMSDIGQKGDRVASDGIYTAKLPSISKQSVVDIEYILQWKNLSTPVIKKDQIKIEYYPEIKITEINDLSGKSNQEIKVLKLQTSVNTYPFLVTPEEIKLSLDESINHIKFRVEPLKIPDSDKSYEFNVYALSEIKTKDETSIEINLSTIFLDQQYTSEPILISITTNTNFLYIFGLRYYYWFLILIAVVIISILVLNFTRRAKIYGFMTDVDNNIIVDFSQIKRNSILKMIHPKRIYFKNISELPYQGGFFEFFENEIFINVIPSEKDPSIRLNSVPITGRHSISDGKWIGSTGKQVRFMKEIPYMNI